MIALSNQHGLEVLPTRGKLPWAPQVAVANREIRLEIESMEGFSGAAGIAPPGPALRSA